MREMNFSWRFFVVVIFLAGFFVPSLLGTSSSMTFIWPGYIVLGLAGVLSIGMLFNKVPDLATFLANESRSDGQRTIERAMVGERIIAGEEGKLPSIPGPE